MSSKVLKFSAQWCGPCKMMTKIIHGQDLGVEVQEVDVDENVNVAKEYNVRNIPTLVFLRDGKEVDRTTGALTLDKLKEWIDKNL